MVCGDQPRAATCGTLDRPGVDVAGVTGLAVAGDWVGPAGTLADAAIVSGHAAASAIIDATMTPTSHLRMTALDDGGAAFEAARPKLIAIAYRMLGSVAEAEDVIGDVAERWAVADRERGACARGLARHDHDAPRPRRAALRPLPARELPRRLAAGADRHGRRPGRPHRARRDVHDGVPAAARTAHAARARRVRAPRRARLPVPRRSPRRRTRRAGLPAGTAPGASPRHRARPADARPTGPTAAASPSASSPPGSAATSTRSSPPWRRTSC